MRVGSFSRANLPICVEVKKGATVANRNKLNFHAAVLCCSLTVLLGLKIQSAAALDAAPQTASTDQSTAKPKPAAQKPVVSANAATSGSSQAEQKTASSSTANPAAPDAPKKKKAKSDAKGPYYVDFRARTAASYGHAFVWFGKSSEKKVDVAGLHPAGDELPFILGHVIPVPAETGASYGDLDPEYLTANYRVYMSEEDSKRVFAYIRKLQKNTKFWNEMTSNCITFLADIASFMGLKTPFYMKVPEDYVNALKEANGGREKIQLAAETTK